MPTTVPIGAIMIYHDNRIGVANLLLRRGHCSICCTASKSSGGEILGRVWLKGKFKGKKSWFECVRCLKTDNDYYSVKLQISVQHEASGVFSNIEDTWLDKRIKLKWSQIPHMADKRWFWLIANTKPNMPGSPVILRWRRQQLLQWVSSTTWRWTPWLFQSMLRHGLVHVHSVSHFEYFEQNLSRPADWLAYTYTGMSARNLMNDIFKILKKFRFESAPMSLVGLLADAEIKSSWRATFLSKSPKAWRMYLWRAVCK